MAELCHLYLVWRYQFYIPVGKKVLFSESSLRAARNPRVVYRALGYLFLGEKLTLIKCRHVRRLPPAR